MTNIFVGNLPYQVSEPELRRAFERFGRVSSVRIMTDRETNRGRGFAFVAMPSLDDADEAIRGMSGVTLGGRQLTVNESRDDRSDRSSSFGTAERDKARELFEMLLDD